MRDFLVIVRRNFFSPIVIAILTLAVILLILNDPRDAYFISVVIILNTVLAIVQEVRAELALKKLELMSAPIARRELANGDIENVPFDQLVVNDIVHLQTGDEVPADGQIVTTSGLEADESMLTGESAPVEKEKTSIIYAASAVVAGNATMRVMAVGPDTKVGKMSETLKRYIPRLTPLQKAIWKAITWLTYGALALAVLIFVVYFLSGQDALKIFKTITSAAVTVVPEGLLLASSLLLAFGSLKLAQAKVLPQKLAAIEAMALLNVLCVDKTGTLTSDEVTFEKLVQFDKSIPDVGELASIVARETSVGNATGDAIIAGLSEPKQYNVLQTLPFSSARKMSGVSVTYNGKPYSILIGAPEFLGDIAKQTIAQKRQIEQLTSEGKRVLLMVSLQNTKASLKSLTAGSGKPVGLLVLGNELRDGVEKTVSYLQNNGVSIRVISGDNPTTVQYIASHAGINNHQNVITGAELMKVKDKDWDTTIAKTTIFARVLPEQKEHLIETFEKLGNFTGMVGDGVNDALAIKKADLGVAMFAGASATRRVADIVLLNNSFNSLPIGMKLGNRIMQSIELIASLFFHKIIYGVVLLLSTLLLGIVYPFEPRHITFMNIFLVTLPTIMWTLFTPSPKSRLSPKYFWRDTLWAVAPIAVLSGVMVTITYGALRMLHPEDLSGVSTTTVLVATFFGIYLVFLVPKMFNIRNNRTSRLARLLYVLAVIIVIIPSFRLSIARDFFNFTTPAWQDTWPIFVTLIVVATLQFYIATMAGKRLRNRESLSKK
ncbi:HAD-IC family P-type ATPase [soil metagenome]